MLNIKQARKAFDEYPDDPYVVLPGHNIEVRFNEDGTIAAAYDADYKPNPSLSDEENAARKKWQSEAFLAYLNSKRGGRNELPREEEPAKIAPQEQLARPRRPQRVRLDAAEAFRRPQRRRED